MGDRRTKEDHVQLISTSIFFTNFPEHFSFRDLWRACQVYGRVVDAYIPNRRSKTDTRFGFVRFIQVKDVDHLVRNLCTIWVDRLRLHANVARFQRPPLKNVSNDYRINVEKMSSDGGPSRVNVSTDHGNSYAGVVKQKGSSNEVDVDNQPSIVLDDSCIRQGDLSLSLMGKVKDFGSLSNLKLILAKEGFVNLNLKYMLYNMLQTCFFIDSRVTWVDIEGVPLNAWTINTFSKISSKWGELLYEEDKENFSLNNKRVCINTTMVKNVFESFKIIVNGKTYWVRAKEVSGWVPDFMEDEEEEEYSDEEIEAIDSEKVKNNRESERDSDVEEVSEIVFEQHQEGFTQEGINNNVEEVLQSEDPFNIYDLLYKKQHDTNNEAENSSCTLKYPPGFTPEENVIDKSDFVDQTVREENVDAKKAVDEKSIHEIKNSKTKTSSKGEDNASRCSRHFRRIKDPPTGGSILQLLEDVVKVGQTMGYKMDGCVRNIEDIIDTQGENEIYQ
ncbi:nucleotide-binding alpha-beta plait domain-containing protein [Tanacetum coccineum]